MNVLPVVTDIYAVCGIQVYLSRWQMVTGPQDIEEKIKDKKLC